jgi:hypothetical protein
MRAHLTSYSIKIPAYLLPSFSLFFFVILDYYKSSAFFEDFPASYSNSFIVTWFLSLFFYELSPSVGRETTIGERFIDSFVTFCCPL